MKKTEFIIFFLIISSSILLIGQYQNWKCIPDEAESFYLQSLYSNNNYTMKTESIIHVQKNEQLAYYASAGNGTWNAPYIIENRILDANLSGDCIFISNTNKYFVLRNCTLLNSGSYYSGLNLDNVTNAKIINNTFRNNNIGILLQDSSDNQIMNNTFYDNQYGVHTGSINYITHNNSFEDNVCFRNIYGISLENSCNNSISNNVCYNNTYGLFLSFANGHFIQNNTIYLNWEGIGVLWTNHTKILNNSLYENSNGIYLFESHYNNLTRNIIFESKENAIWIQKSMFNAILNISAYDNKNYGIFLDYGSNNNQIIANRLTNNRKGIYEDQSCRGNIFSNNFVQDPLSPSIWAIIGIGLAFGLLFLAAGNRYFERTRYKTGLKRGILAAIVLVTILFNLFMILYFNSTFPFYGTLSNFLLDTISCFTIFNIVFLGLFIHIKSRKI